jgi:hypothetical protein
MANTTFNGPVRSQNGFQSITTNATTGAVTVNATFGAATSVTDLTTTNLVFTDQNHPTKAALTATATLSAAQVATGYITVTSATAVTLTLPTGTSLGTAIGATQGTVLELYIDNTASTSSGAVTVAVATNGILSSAAADTPGSFGDLTIPVGATGLARFTIMFSSATAYVFTRTA